jgi:inhibitor of Bruton tyrosine kinase
MADIQSLQAAEKIVAAEAVSKRNLLDIQAEQQFQEWWDKESARIQEEEAAEAARTARGNSKTYRGGRGGRKRSGEGRGKKIVVPSSSVDAPTPSDPRSARGEQNRWRGKGKGKAGAD